jgi:hypothetical protein
MQNFVVTRNFLSSSSESNIGGKITQDQPAGQGVHVASHLTDTAALTERCRQEGICFFLILCLESKDIYNFDGCKNALMTIISNLR